MVIAIEALDAYCTIRDAVADAAHEDVLNGDAYKARAKAPCTITATSFHYHGEEDESRDKSDPKRYGKFMCDNVIRTTCGRVTKG